MKALKKSLMLLMSIILLQQSLEYIGHHNQTLQNQKSIIMERGMEPALLFYTESEDALLSEKSVRAQLE